MSWTTTLANWRRDLAELLSRRQGVGQERAARQLDQLVAAFRADSRSEEEALARIGIFVATCREQGYADVEIARMLREFPDAASFKPRRVAFEEPVPF